MLVQTLSPRAAWIHNYIRRSWEVILGALDSRRSNGSMTARKRSGSPIGPTRLQLVIENTGRLPVGGALWPLNVSIFWFNLRDLRLWAIQLMAVGFFPTVSFPSENESGLPDRSRKPRDLRHASTERARQELEHVKEPKHVVIAGGLARKLGDSVVLGLLLTTAVLKRWPSAELVVLENRYPEVFRGFSRRQLSVYRNLDLASPPAGFAPDLWLDLQSSENISVYPGNPKIFTGLSHHILQAEIRRSSPDRIRQALFAIGFAGPLSLWSLVSRPDTIADQEFFNPHGQTNSFKSHHVEAWAQLIRARLIAGKKAVLNHGLETDAANTEAIRQAVESTHPGQLSIFKGEIGALQEEIGKSERTFTIDTSIFWISLTLGVPVMVFTTSNSGGGWINRTPGDGEIFVTIPFASFLNAPIDSFTQALEQLRNLTPSSHRVSERNVRHIAGSA
jgi:hypothetical protein